MSIRIITAASRELRRGGGTASSAKSKKPMSKVAKALAKKPASETADAGKTGEAPAGEAKPAADSGGGATGADPKP